MAVMQRKHVSRRLRTNITSRDIAWAQMHDPDLLVKAEIPFLTTQQLQVVKQVYAPQGGLDAEFLASYEDAYDELPDGTYILVSPKERASHMYSPKRTKHDVFFTPVRRLAGRYGVLDVQPSTNENTRESKDIDHNAIPVGTLAIDSTPARLVTGTIDTTTTLLKYTVQPLNKDFVYVRDHKTRNVPTGHKWTSSGNMPDDVEVVEFAKNLRDLTFHEVVQHVFHEQRKNKDDDFVWRSLQDMQQYPDLCNLVSALDKFVQSDNVDGTNEGMALADLSKTFQDMVQDLVTVAVEAESLQDQVKGKSEDEKRAAVIGSMKVLWQTLGNCVQVFLRRRRDMEYLFG